MDKTYVFDGATGSNMESALIGSMMNGGMNGGGMWNNPIWAIVFLAALRNGGLFGNDGCGYQSQLSQIQDTLNTNQGNTLLMDAIKGNATAVGQLASTINCNYNAVQGAINAVQSAIAGVGNQVGMGQLQVVNAVQAGNTTIANQIAQCCCDNKLLVTTQGYENRLNNERQSQLIQNGFSQVGYASAEQTCAIKQAIADQTASVIGKIDAQESARKDREINALTAQLATVNARAERAAELAPIYKALEEIKGKQPSTAVVQWPNLVGIPASQLYGYGVYANGGQFG